MQSDVPTCIIIQKTSLVSILSFRFQGLASSGSFVLIIFFATKKLTQFFLRVSERIFAKK